MGSFPLQPSTEFRFIDELSTMEGPLSIPQIASFLAVLFLRFIYRILFCFVFLCLTFSV
ncbi:unnamed protein product [Meloidogyne enterolobii]|uniref:Uncharacterized protein n=2 Tax=Meloidogyne enterolobii TaxID=390850 RepID=A0ACB0ZFJ0_MELEN|nr:unnamed protein product [Meloidogyne enterolobii]